MTEAPTISMVAMADLHTDPLNPRRITERDLERLKRSIVEDPDFMRLRPILARPDGSIYAGNMRYEAAKALGWTEVPAIVTDDPEAVLRKRAVKDNTQFGEWVEEELAEYLHVLADMDPQVDIDALGLDDRLLAEMGTIDVDFGTFAPAMPPGDLPPSVGGQPNPAAGHDNMELMPNDDRTQVAMEATADIVYKTAKGEAEPVYDIPIIRSDMLVERLPEGLTTWAGVEANQDDGSSWFLYNYSPNGTWTDVPLARVIVSFFTDDRFLYRWVANPSYYLSRMRAAGVTMAVELDLSPYIGMPWILRAMQVYRSHWTARFMQDWGIKVIPRVCYPWLPDPDRQNDLAVVGLPDHCPVLAFNMQNSGHGKDDRDEYAKALGRGLTWFFGEGGKSCDQLLVYGDALWDQVMGEAELPDSMEVVVLPSFLKQRRELGLPWRNH